MSVAVGMFRDWFTVLGLTALVVAVFLAMFFVETLVVAAVLGALKRANKAFKAAREFLNQTV